MDQFKILRDGTYEIDAGAYCGIVPKALWSKYFDDTNNKLRISMNIPFFETSKHKFILDSGIGNNFSDNFIKNFNPGKEYDLIRELREHDVKKLDYVIISHLHFDHSGYAFSKNDAIKNAKIIVQSNEIKAFKNPNEFTRGSYLKHRIYKNISAIDGTKKINSNISVILTGGHTEGHQAIIVSIDSKKYLYGGDLFPSAFHIKPYYLTAIDSYPISSLRMKKKLLKKAINEHMIMIFNHDNKLPLAEISGNVNKPELNPVDF